MAKRCSNEVRPSSARILPLQWERKASHLIQQIPSGNLFPLSPQGEGRVQRLPLEGKLPPWAADEVLLTYILPLRCGRKAFHLIHRKRSPLPSRGRQKPFLQPGSKRSPHSVRRSSGRTPRTRSGLRSATGLGPRWGPVRPTDATAENSAGHVPPARSAAFPAESTGLLPARTK